MYRTQSALLEAFGCSFAWIAQADNDAGRFLRPEQWLWQLIQLHLPNLDSFHHIRMPHLQIYLNRD